MEATTRVIVGEVSRINFQPGQTPMVYIRIAGEILEVYPSYPTYKLLAVTEKKDHVRLRLQPDNVAYILLYIENTTLGECAGTPSY